MIETDMVLAGLLPQLLFAVTEIVPPAEPAVVVIEFVEDDPVHPDGNAHV